MSVLAANSVSFASSSGVMPVCSAFQVSARGLVGSDVEGRRITASGLAEDFVIKRRNKLAGVPQEIYDGIKGLLETAAASGQSERGLADSIREAFDQTYEGRAETVARTETASAYGSASQASLEDSSWTHKRWLSAHDSAVRDSHREMDGEVVPVDERFSNGLMFPGDPDGPAEEVINCRCVSVAATPEEVAALEGGE